jgi:hypothetical protein
MNSDSMFSSIQSAMNIQITKAVSQLEIDHILYAKKVVSKGNFDFISCFNTAIWIYIFISLIVLLSLNLIFDKSMKAFNKRIWFYVTTLFAPSKLEPKSKGRIPVVLWLFAIFILGRYFTGEMFGILVRPPEYDLIDTWQDLVDHKDVPIKVVTFYSSCADYFRESPNAVELTERCSTMGIDHFAFDKDRLLELLNKVANGEFAWLLWKEFEFHFKHLELEGNNDIRWDELHWSKIGRPEPYFLAVMVQSQEDELLYDNINKM